MLLSFVSLYNTDLFLGKTIQKKRKEKTHISRVNTDSEIGDDLVSKGNASCYRLELDDNNLSFKTRATL